MRTVGLGLFALVMVGCGAAAREPASSSAARAGGGAAYGAPAAEMAPSGAAMSDAEPGAPPAPVAAPSRPSEVAKPASPIARREPVTPLPRSGQLTAGVWDDNLNFDFFRPYAAKMVARDEGDNAMFSATEQESARKAAVQAGPKTELDVQLVLDTTGSMGDELRYLQSELDAIAAQLRARFPNVTPRWSLVVYRDHGDQYVTRDFDFTTDTNRFRANLRAQSAAGGGDTPEAVVEGLSTALRQSWRVEEKNVAKIAFWVADAPAHPGEGRALANVLRTAKAKGVHLYPIASSDTDETAEYQMRSAAQITNGRYVFLTDDSGIGNAHAEPHIPCYNVTRLDHAIVRMIEVELSGRYVEAAAQDVVRQVGRPDKEGKCKLASGMLVASY